MYGSPDSISAALLPEFDREFANTRRTLERVPADRLDWGPHPKSMTFRGLVTHLANIPVWGSLVVDGDQFDLEPVGGPSTRVEVVDSVDEALARLDENVAKARTAIEGTTDEHWRGPWSLKSAGETLFSMPRVAVVRSMVMNHGIHHRGQMTVYLRSCEVPVPALYGPSADEASGT